MEKGEIYRRSERKKREKTEEIAVFSEFPPWRFAGAVDMNSRKKKKIASAIPRSAMRSRRCHGGDNFDLSFVDARLERRLSPNSCVPRNSAKFLLVNG